MRMRMRKKRSKRECRLQSHTGGVTEMWTDHADLHLHATDEAGHLEEGAGPPKEEAHHLDVNEIGIATAAKVPVDIAADPGTEDIVLNLQVTTEAIGIAVTPSPQKVGLRRVIRVVEEKRNNQLFFFMFLWSEMYGKSK